VSSTAATTDSSFTFMFIVHREIAAASTFSDAPLPFVL
jgi:hypothetical protein